jgi:UDP-N-acetylmuramate--alanine ligase
MYHKNTHIHFVGIGGIGMSGIAHILKAQGYTISGCDKNIHQKSIADLAELGCEIYEGNNTPLCSNPSINILVYSSAIHEKNLEIKNAQERGIPTIPRALMLAELMRTKYSIAIAGSHGKTTTTSLISHILMEAKKDPTVIIGGHLKSIGSNARLGAGDYLVAESDESDRSFLHLYPTLAVVTNIDLEHLDVYRDLEDIKNSFKQFLSNIPFYGKAVVCLDDANIRSLLPITHIKIGSYGIDSPAEWTAHNIHIESDHSVFDLYHNGIFIDTMTISIPGKHNLLNTLAAIAICRELGVSLEVIKEAIASFKGVERRFSFMGSYKDAEFFDDYGHHPTEIKNSFLVARKRTKNKLIVVFQPHRYSRTEKLWNDFLQALKAAPIDYLIMTDIYGASEEPIPGITTAAFVKELQELKPSFPVVYTPVTSKLEKIQESLELVLEKDDLVLLLGAGNTNALFTLLKNK